MAPISDKDIPIKKKPLKATDFIDIFNIYLLTLEIDLLIIKQMLAI